MAVPVSFFHLDRALMRRGGGTCFFIEEVVGAAVGFVAGGSIAGATPLTPVGVVTLGVAKRGISMSILIFERVKLIFVIIAA